MNCMILTETRPPKIQFIQKEICQRVKKVEDTVNNIPFSSIFDLVSVEDLADWSSGDFYDPLYKKLLLFLKFGT